MLKKDLENHVKTTNFEMGAIQTNICWIKESVDGINSKVGKINDNIGKINLKIGEHDKRIESIENREKRNFKEKWFRKEYIWGLMGSFIVGIIFVVANHYI